MWKPELLQTRTYITDFNPFFHLLEIVRAPLLGAVPTTENYLVVCADHPDQRCGRRRVLHAISRSHFILGLTAHGH